MGKKQHIILTPLLIIVAAILALAATAAAQSSSSNYRVNEVFFGSGGELEACSGSYCAKQSAGELGVGETSSNSYRAQVGFNTTDVPLLEVAVNGNVNFGALAFDEVRSGSAQVQVRTYLANGYIMTVTGTPPKNGSHIMNAPGVPTASQPGTEQFGINLRANSSPSVGADPVQVPDGSFSFGAVTANYNTPNYFMYQTGDTVAYSNSSSGRTDYTFSMIANASRLTPGGVYTTDLSVVVTATF